MHCKLTVIDTKIFDNHNNLFFFKKCLFGLTTKNVLKTLLEQRVFRKITFLSFDDNKLLKNCQLDMLNFVQVYRTIIKVVMITRFWLNKSKSKGICIEAKII